MSLTIVTAPTIEPFLLDEAKAFLNVTVDDDNTLVESLITASRQHCETYTQRAFLTQTWDDKRDGFPCGGEPIWLPLAPLLTSTAPVVTYTDTDGASQTFSSGDYTVDAPSGPYARQGRLFLNYQEVYPQTRRIENAVNIRFVCGYGATAATVPEGIKTAMKILIAHWYVNREPVITGTIVATIPMSVDALLWPFKSF